MYKGISYLSGFFMKEKKAILILDWQFFKNIIILQKNNR